MKKKLLYILTPYILTLVLVVGLGAVLETSQGTYRLARDADADDTGPATYGFYARNTTSTVDIMGKGSDSEVNGLMLIFVGDGDDGDTAAVDISAYRHGGPQEHVATLALTLGTRHATYLPDGSTAGSDEDFVDTITVTDETWLKTVAVSDASGDNRVARVHFDACGYRYFDFKISNMDDADADGKMDGMKIYYASF